VAKHIDKTTKEEEALKKLKKENSSESQPHDQGIYPKKIDISDPMEVQPRIITFTNKFSNTSREERVKKKSEKFKDQVNNTDQYLRFVNGLIKEKMSRLDQLIDGEKKFQDQVNVLQNKIKSRFDLDKLNSKYMTSDDARDIVFYLEEEFERMKDKLLYQELIVQKTKDEIASKRRQIQQVKEELKDLLHKKEESPITDPISVLKEELKKAGITENSKIFKVLDDVSEYLSKPDKKLKS
jgi:hypothetical protein